MFTQYIIEAKPVQESLKVVIFDCDGVLVDSERIAVRIDVELISDLGSPISEDEVIRRFVGRSREAMLTEIQNDLGIPLPTNWETELDRRYAAALHNEITPVDGIIDALDCLQLQTCVASNGNHEKMRSTLGRTGLYDRFEGNIFSATDVAHGKPAPDLFLYAAEQMHVPPSRCVVVEDSVFGVQAARAANMRVLGYAGGVTPAKWLTDQGAELLTDMRRLPGLLSRIHR